MNVACRVAVRWFRLRLTAPLFVLLLVPAVLWGTTWFPDERLSNDPGVSQAPSIAADLSGNLHVTWHDDCAGNFEIYYRRWDGVGWTNEERLTFAGETSAWPVITSDRVGKVHVVWYDYRLGTDHPQIFCKHGDGFTWSEDERVSLGADWAVVPTLIADPLNRLHAIWYDNRNNGDWEIYHRSWDGQTWGAEERLTDNFGESRYPAAIADDEGNIYVVWQDRRNGNWEIYLKLWDGLAWGPDQRLTADPHNSLRPAIATDMAGIKWVVWQDDREGASEIYYKRYDGVSWTPDSRLSDADGSASTEPAIGTDRSGRVYVAWQDARNGETELYFKAWDGVRWTADERVTDAPGSTVWPSLAVDPIGAVHLVWQDSRDGNPEIYHKTRSAPEPPGPPPVVDAITPPAASDFGTREFTLIGSHFGVPALVRLIPEVGDALIGTTIQVTETSILARFDMTDAPVGMWAAAVTTGAGQADTLHGGLQVYESPWADEGRLTSNSAASSLPSNGGRALTLDPSGTLHLFWFDNRDGNQEIYWKSREGGVWSADVRLTNDPGLSSNPVAASSTLGNVVVAWQEMRDGNSEIYFKTRSGGSWSADTRLTSEPSPSIHPALAADPFGNLHIVWQDGRSGSYQIYYSRMSNGVWTPLIRLSQGEGTSAYPTVVSDSEGNVYAAWMDNRDGNWEIYATKFADGAWEAEHRITFDTMTSAYPSMVTDGEACFVAWQDQRNGRDEIFLRRLDIEDTDHRLVFDQGASRAPMIDRTEDHQIHLVWSDTRTGTEQVWYKVYDPALGAWSLDHRVSGSSLEATLPSILAGSNNAIEVVWRDLRDGNTEIYNRSRGEILPSQIDGSEPVAILASLRGSPNPFRDSIQLRFGLPAEQQVVLQIFDVQGRRVRTLRDGALGPGIHEIRWDGSGDDRRDLGPGVYYYRLIANGRGSGGAAVRLP